MIPTHLYLMCRKRWLLPAQWKLPGYQRVMKCWRTIVSVHRHWVGGVMDRMSPLLFLRAQFCNGIEAGCAGGAATRVTVTDIRVEGVVKSLFQERRCPERCVFQLLVPGCCVLGMVPSLRFGLLFPGQKKLCVDFPLRL